MTALLPSLLTPPAALALPGLDRGRAATSATHAAAQQAWPAIEALVAREDAAAAAREMESLADRMQAATAADPEPWRETLTMCRAILYDDLAYLARLTGGRTPALDALTRRRGCDPDLAEHLDELIGAVRAVT